MRVGLAALSALLLSGLGLSACTPEPTPSQTLQSRLHVSNPELEYYETRTEVLAPPNNWWGWAARVHGAEQGRIAEILAGKDGHLYAFELWGKADTYGAAIVDTFTGREIASTVDTPDLGRSSKDRAREAELGLERISSSLFRQSPIERTNERLQCGRPNISKFTLRSSNDGIYLYRFLPTPVTFEEDDFCDESWGTSDPAGRTLGYESTGGAIYQPLRDGTILVLASQYWIVRFKPDLTSPFFAGRRDLIRVESRPVDAIVKRYKPYRPGEAAEAIKAVSEYLILKAEEQAAE